jgi:STIMATE family
LDIYLDSSENHNLLLYVGVFGAVFGAFLFKPLQANKHFELVFVMILFPGLLNCVYFWIADSYLKAKHDAPGGAHEKGIDDESGRTDSLLHDIAESEVKKNKYVPAPWSALTGSQQSIPAESLHEDVSPQTKVI